MLNCPFKVIPTAVVGPSSLLRESLKGILRPPYQAEIITETIESLRQIVDLNLIILLADTDRTALLAQLQRAKAAYAGARVVVLSDIDTFEVRPLLVAGADGCLLTKISPEALRASLDAVMLGATVVQPMPKKSFTIETCTCLDKGEAEIEIPQLDAEAKHPELSERETKILLCLTKGESNKHIARKCEITEGTVKVHLKSILRKLRVSNRTQAAMWAHNEYFARPPRIGGRL